MTPFKNILCVAEQGDMETVQRAASLAKKMDARLTVAAFVPDIPREARLTRLAAEVAVLVESLKSTVLNDLHRLTQGLDLAIEVVLLQGAEFLAVIQRVMREGHDLLIKRAQDPDWLERIFGSDDMHLLRKCPCPVWLVKPDADKTLHTVLAAIDVDSPEAASISAPQTQTPLSREILRLAARLAQSESASLHIVHAWDAPAESLLRSGRVAVPHERVDEYVHDVQKDHRRRVAALLDELERAMGVESYAKLHPQLHFQQGWARQLVPELAQELNADVVVMGTVGRAGIPGLVMGNTAEDIVNQIRCSVLAVKPQGFHSPVAVN